MLGASERPSVGRTIVENLERIGFDGKIYPINPRYESLLGRPCYRSVEDLPDGVDVLAFCVNHERVLDGLRPAARKRIRAAVAFDAGFAESDESPRSAEIGVVFTALTLVLGFSIAAVVIVFAIIWIVYFA